MPSRTLLTWQAKKITDNSVPELQSFVELVGGMSSGELALINAEDMTRRFKSESVRFADAVNQMAASDGTMAPLLEQPLICGRVVVVGARPGLRITLGAPWTDPAPLRARLGSRASGRRVRRSLDAGTAAAELVPHLWYDQDWAYAAPAALARHPRRDECLRELLRQATGAGCLSVT